jgi:hypothetical protein
MKRKLAVLSAVAALVSGAGANAATILLQDNFDGYANQAAFVAAWPGAASGTLSSSVSFSSPNSINDSGVTAMRNTKAIAAHSAPSAAAPIIYSFRFFDSNGAASAYRQSSDLVDGGASASGQIVGMGLSNNIASTFYMGRVQGADGGAGASAFFKLDATPSNTRTTGWHELRAVITNTTVDFYVDGNPGKLGVTGFTARTFDTFRIGSNLTSTQSANYDDVTVIQGAPSLGLSTTGVGTTQGTITLTGSGGNYDGGLVDITNSTSGNVEIDGMGAESGHVLALLDLTDAATTNDLNALVTALTGKSGINSVARVTNLATQAPWAVGMANSNKFDIVLDITKVGSTPVFLNYADLNTLAGGTLVLDRVAVVPEPTTLTLAGMSALGLIARRRRA